MRKLILPLFSILVLLTAGCHTSYYYAEFIKPSEVFIPSVIYRVGMINRSSVDSNVAPVYTGGVPYAYARGVPRETSEHTLEILKKRLETIGRFEIVEITYDQDKIDPEKFVAPMLSQAWIDSLGQAYNLDGLIALDGVEMLIRTRGDVDVVTVSDDLGVPVRVPEFSKESLVSYSVFWRFYDAYDPKVLDEYQETYERIFTRTAYDEAEIAAVSSEDMNLIDVGGVAAMDYFARISPHWVAAYRQYYRSGSPRLREIGDMVYYDENWEKAAEEWKKLTTDESPSVRYKAMYNMAVASEMLSSPRVAKDWLEEAMEVKSTARARNYMETLERQILVYKVVNDQLGLR